MYGDVPLILQGAAQRETLSPEQLARLQSQGISTQGAPVNVSSVLLPLIVGVGAAWFLAGGSRRRTLWSVLFAMFLASCAVSAQTPIASLTDAPITMTGTARTQPLNSVVASEMAFDSLRVVMAWRHPTDGLGNEDSTVFKFRSTKAGVFQRGNFAVAANTKVRRKFNATVQADTFKMLKPAVGDSVMFNVDTIFQCRRGLCATPGSAAWGYKRDATPPAMTFIRVSVDSF